MVANRRVSGFVAVLMLAFLISCATQYEFPALPPPMTKVVPVGFEDAFQITHSVLRDDGRLVVHTVDNAGRFVAWEKTGGFIFFQHRTVLDIRLEALDGDRTRVTMQLSAEGYELGGLTRPADWYPSSEVDTFLGEDILRQIEQKAERAAS